MADDDFFTVQIPFEGEPENYAGQREYKPVVNTARAVGVVMNGVMTWLPKSQIRNVTVDADSVTVDVPEWLIKDKGLDMYVSG